MQWRKTWLYSFTYLYPELDAERLTVTTLPENETGTMHAKDV